MSNNIIKFKPDYLNHKNYKNHLREYLQHLEAFNDVTFEAAINMATSGRWKRWNDKQKEGNTMVFTDEMLLNSGDEAVDEVMKVFATLRVAISTLKRKAKISGK